MSEAAPVPPQSGLPGGNTPASRRPLAAATLVVSVLQAVFFAMAGTSVLPRIGGGGLALATASLAWATLRAGSPSRLRILMLLWALGLTLFSSQAYALTPPYAWRPVLVAVTLSHGAIVVGVVLAASRLIRPAEALLLSFSLSLTLLALDMLASRLPKPKMWRGPEGTVQALHDPILHHVYAPHSTAVLYYPDNPRGYFEAVDARTARWSLETHEGGAARLELPPGDPPRVRVVIERLQEQTPWLVQLSRDRGRLSLRRGRHYALTAKIRADAARIIGFAAGQAHPPWQSLGVFGELEVGPEWKTLVMEFEATADDDEARLVFYLGGNEHAVEVGDASLEGLPGRDVLGSTAPKYSVSFRFNELGCRGRDYAIPRPAGINRVLLLGDSYVMGMGVHERDTVSVRLEELLNEHAKASGSRQPSFEVINCGVSGYATREERISYELSSSRYQAQLVLIGMVFNDDEFLDGPEVPNGRAADAFALWGVLEQHWKLKALRDFSQSIEEIKKLQVACHSRGARLAVFFFRHQALRDAWKDLVAQVSRGLQGTGLPVLDLGPVILKGHSDKDLLVHGELDGHPNEIGHGLAAQGLLRFLDQEHLLEGLSQVPAANPAMGSSSR